MHSMANVPGVQEKNVPLYKKNPHFPYMNIFFNLVKIRLLINFPLTHALVKLKIL